MTKVPGEERTGGDGSGPVWEGGDLHVVGGVATGEPGPRCRPERDRGCGVGEW